MFFLLHHVIFLNIVILQNVSVSRNLMVRDVSLFSGGEGPLFWGGRS